MAQRRLLGLVRRRHQQTSLEDGSEARLREVLESWAAGSEAASESASGTISPALSDHARTLVDQYAIGTW